MLRKHALLNGLTHARVSGYAGIKTRKGEDNARQ